MTNSKMGQKRGGRRSKTFGKSKTLGDLTQRLIGPALRRRGFANTSLIMDWAAIAPAPYNSALIPVSLKWPRRGTGGPSVATGEADAVSDGATLYVRVDPAHALQFAHEAHMVRDAINRYFGFYLVASIRPDKSAFATSAPAEKPAVAPAAPCPPTPGLKSITDKELRGALERLGSGIAAKDRQIQE